MGRGEAIGLLLDLIDAIAAESDSAAASKGVDALLALGVTQAEIDSLLGAP